MAIVESESRGFSTRSAIPSIRNSLKYHADVFLKLCLEMRKFSGLSQNERSRLRNAIKDTFKTFSEHGDYEAIVDEHFRNQSDKAYVYGTRFGAPYMVHAIPVVLLSCSLAEALIKSLVAMGLVKSRKDKLFPVFDRMELKDKWCLGPSLFSEDIGLDLGNHLFSELKDLIGVRNAFMHNKAEFFSNDGKQILKSSPKDQLSMSINGQKRLIKFAHLPDRLCDLVLASVSDREMRSYLEIASFR